MSSTKLAPVVGDRHTKPQEIDVPDQDSLSPPDRTLEDDETIYDSFFHDSSGDRLIVRPVLIMNSKVTFCGVTKTLRKWVQESGLREATVRARLARKMGPIAALTSPDRAGRCLKPLDAEHLESHRKTQQKARSGAISISCGGDCTHVAGIMAHGRKLFLGQFGSGAEAVFAFNRAVDLLPGEYEASDKYKAVGEALDPTNRVRIENAVRLIFEAHGLPGEPESQRSAD